jgi:mono/diheme cytochrome c family protein
MDDRQTEFTEEKKSRSVLFLLSAVALLATGVWAVWNDNVSRRPWKRYQWEFRHLEYHKASDALDAEQKRLEAEPEYQKLQQQLVAARASLERGETAQQIAKQQADLEALNVRLNDIDLEVRLVKSELEEAWYEYDHAKELGRPSEARRARIDTLEQHRVVAQAKLDELKAQQAQMENAIKELQAGVTNVESKIEEVSTERNNLQQKRDGLVVPVAGPISMLKVPKIEQTILLEYDRNAYNQPVSRVDRCVSCHIAIDKKGFEDQPQPFATHPDREVLLGKHPVEKLGCTPCHEGQGPAVNSVAQAHGDVPFWGEPLLRGDEIQARCDGCHAVAEGLPHAQDLAAGRRLFEQLGCHGCHLVQGYGDLQKVGPYLRRIGAKVDPSWLLRWVTNPHEYRPSTKMPNFMFQPEQATAVAAYLLKASADESASWQAEHPDPGGIDPGDAELVARGEVLTKTVGCRGCHAFEAGKHGPVLGAEKDIVPNLSNVAEKTDGRWLFHWLKNPRHFSPVSRMPSLRLSDDEARALASYLLTLGAKKAEPAARLAALDQPETIAAGEKLVRKYGCFGCHDIPGMESESRVGVELTTFGSKSVDELFFGERLDIPHTWHDWTFNKLKTPRTYATERIEQAMPQFDLSDEDIRHLIVFLTARNDHVVPAMYRYKPDDPLQQRVIEGERLVAKYNCTGCHVIAGQGGFIRRFYEDRPSYAPPILNGEGAKVQPDWLFSFLKAPVPIRPWLQLRMPTFNLPDEEAAALVEYFGAMAQLEVPFVYVNADAIPPGHIQAGRLLMSPDYFSCFSCHVRGDKKPEGPPEGWAPDFAMAKHRLNPEWIVEWLHDPQKVQPGTKMPSFYPGGPDDVLGGDDEAQIRALRDYLMVIGTPAEDRALQTVQRDGTPAS